LKNKKAEFNFNVRCFTFSSTCRKFIMSANIMKCNKMDEERKSKLRDNKRKRERERKKERKKEERK
jgi:hypothetical protein